ncbi:MAG: hypothetical protein QM451_11075 [Bacillota bacterium]|jgi:hypothetical protein|nr:hypothetical protein [Bacillota bacterium]
MKSRPLVALLCLTLAACLNQAVPVFGAEGVDQVILLLWHGLSWEDIQGMQLDGPAAWAWLNTRSAGGEALTAAYLSIGAGARANGLAGAAAFYQGEPGYQLFSRHTGLEPSSIVQPRIAEIRAVQPANYVVEPGALGSALSEAGMAVRVMGNSDGLDPHGWAALVAMDTWGRVWHGSVGSEFTLADSAYPYGIRTDYARLGREVQQAEEPFVVVDLGDPFRFEQYQDQLLPEQRTRLRERMVREAYGLVQGLLAGRRPGTAVMMVSAYPSQALLNRGYSLTPVLCWGLEEGLLTSATTRWPGLICNMDLAPTILELLGVDHDQSFIGRPASVEPLGHKEAQLWLSEMAEKIGFLAQYRGLVLRMMVIAQILIYTAVLLSLVVASSLPAKAVRFLQLGLLLLLAAPLFLLLWNSHPWAALAVIVGVVILSVRRVQSLVLVGFLSLAVTVTISFDVVFDSWLMRYSFLGYDPLGGARFYGLGNEFMGILVGSAIMGWATLAEKVAWPRHWRNVLGLFYFGTLLFTIAVPSLGTNVGGAISAVFGFGATWTALTERRVGLGTILCLVLAMAAVLSLLMVVDGSNAQGTQSHIGQTVELVRRDGAAALWMIITRKVAMNIKLLRYSQWSNALIVALVGVGASFIWPSRFIFWLKENHPLTAKAIVGVVIGSTAAFFFNDSGVVAAATCLSFGSSTMLLLALELKHYFAPA